MLSILAAFLSVQNIYEILSMYITVISMYVTVITGQVLDSFL